MERNSNKSFLHKTNHVIKGELFSLSINQISPGAGRNSTCSLCCNFGCGSGTVETLRYKYGFILKKQILLSKKKLSEVLCKMVINDNRHLLSTSVMKITDVIPIFPVPHVVNDKLYKNFTIPSIYVT